MAKLIFEVLSADLARRSLIERDKQDEVAERLQLTMQASQCKVIDLLHNMTLKQKLTNTLNDGLDTLSAEEQNILVDAINKLHEVNHD